MEKFDKTNPYNPNAKKSYSKKTLISVALFTAIFFIVLIKCTGGSSTIGKYTKEELPKDFTYQITKDESNVVTDKNQLYVQLNEKLTEGQIATLAEELFNSKEKQGRFYIFYSLKSAEDAHVYWATSHFDPELEITINGSTLAEENLVKKNTGKVDGKVIGNFYEEELSSSSYTVYENNNKVFIKSISKDNVSAINEMKRSTVETGIKLEYVNDSFNGEYFILTIDNKLEFYNKNNEKFATGQKLN
jgi:hypothetical protein